MKTRPLKHLDSNELIIIATAMTNYRNKIAGQFEQKLFDTDYQKVMSLGRKAYLDGMGIRHITVALEEYAKYLKRKAKLTYALYGLVKKKEERHEYLDLADKLEHFLKVFQENNCPKIEKASSAGTLNAVAQ